MTNEAGGLHDPQDSGCRLPTSTGDPDVGLSVGKLDRQCRRPTLADTQSVTLARERSFLNGHAFLSFAVPENFD